MPRGRITSLQPRRGFGFIQESAGSTEIYFHWTSLSAGSIDQLREGQLVEFDKAADQQDPSRQVATNLRIVD